MKKYYLSLLFTFYVFMCFAQCPCDGSYSPGGEDRGNNTGRQADNYGRNKRVSFIIGGGASVVQTELYDIPVVNKSNNFVTIEKAGRIKPNLSLGIAYTSFIRSMVQKVKVSEQNRITEKQVVEYTPYGPTFSLFLNPLSLTSVSANSIANTVDVGFGFGWRSGKFSLLITNEYFIVKQPREYFVEHHLNNDRPYVINDNVQTSIDTTDNSIFKNVIAVSWGMKIAYTFDAAKSFLF